MKYLIEKDNQYLLPVNGSEYPIWTGEKKRARTFSSILLAQDCLKAWVISNAKIVEKK